VRNSLRGLQYERRAVSDFHALIALALNTEAARVSMHHTFLVKIAFQYFSSKDSNLNIFVFFVRVTRFERKMAT
jgi:hypothetical protein